MNLRRRINSFALAFSALVGMTYLASPASAQIGGQGVPDLSDFAGAIGKSVESSPTPKANAPGETFKSGLTVPSVKPGETAKGIARQLRESVEKQAGPQKSLAQLEESMPKVLTALEGELDKIGFAKRDLGVAVAYAFITDWETANKQTIPEQPTMIAAKTIATAVAKHWGPKYESLAPEAKEKMYESLLVSTVLMSTFAEQFDKAGKTQEAAGMRQAAGQMFQKLIGVPPSQVKISPEGKITGLAAGPAPTEPPATAPPADPPVTNSNGDSK